MRPRCCRRIARARLAGVAALALLAGSAAPAAAQLAKVEVGDLRLVYISPSEDYLIPHAARSFLNAEQFLDSLFRYTPPDGKITVLLVDFSDYGNAGAGTVPYDSLRIQIAPLSFSFETILASERMSAIMSHELVHVVMMDQAAGRDRAFRRLFAGKVMPIDAQPESVLYCYLTTPRVTAPRWYHEGGAVFIDTWENGGIGRAQGGYDEMVWRAMVKDHAHIFDPLGLVAEGTKIDFQVEVNSYLYGTRFLTWLGYHYSPEQVIDWIARRPGSRAYYASQFQHVFGTPIEKAWSDWIAFEQRFQEANLAAIRKYPLTPYTDLSPRALGSVSRAFVDPAGARLYAGLNYPGSVAHIGSVSLQDGSTTHIRDIKGPNIYQVTSIAFDPSGPTIFYTTDNLAHRDLVALDPATGRAILLQKDARIGDLAFDRADGSLWGVRALNGLDTLVRIDPPYREWTQILDLPVRHDPVRPGRLAGRLAAGGVVRRDQREAERAGALGREAAGGRCHANRHVRLRPGRAEQLRVLAGRPLSVRQLLLHGRVEHLPVRDRDEAARVRDERRDGVLPADPAGRRSADRLPLHGAGVRAGADHGHPAPGRERHHVPGRATGREAPGAEEVGARLAGGHPLRHDAEDGGHVPAGRRAAAGVGLPHPPGLQGHAGGGVSRELLGSAAAQPGERLALVTRRRGRSPDHERVHVRGEYQRYDWNAHAAYNDADFYDLFGPTKVSRKGYNVTVGHTNTLLFDQPRLLTLKMEGTAAGNLDQLPQYQNVPVKVDRLYSLDANLSYSDVRSSLGHVDDEKGQRLSAVAHADYVDHKVFTRLSGTYDVGFALPTGHSSVWIRTATGFSPQSAGEPFANFYFGGFGNNWVDHGDIKRYRDSYAFPGAALNEIGGRNFVRSLVEWELPPLRFAHAGTPGFYLSFLRPALFAGGLVTNLDSADRRTKAATVGGQVDLRFTFLSALDLTLSVGGGLRMEPGVPARREGMVSLALLK